MRVSGGVNVAFRQLSMMASSRGFTVKFIEDPHTIMYKTTKINNEGLIVSCQFGTSSLAETIVRTNAHKAGMDLCG